MTSDRHRVYFVISLQKTNLEPGTNYNQYTSVAHVQHFILETHIIGRWFLAGDNKIIEKASFYHHFAHSMTVYGIFINDIEYFTGPV